MNDAVSTSLSPQIVDQNDHYSRCANISILYSLTTVIPRLTRFSIARIPIARFFEVTSKNSQSAIVEVSIEEIYRVMQIFLELFLQIFYIF